MAGTDSRSPYVGPRPFEARDGEFFFGRHREAHEVASLVLANQLFLLCAPSGAGKTSLFNAGLRPILADEVDVFPTVRLQTRATAGRRSVRNAFSFALLDHLVSRHAAPGVPDLTTISLADYFKQLPRPDDDRGRLVVIDQFEELFTAAPESAADRETFLVDLVEALRTCPELKVLLLLRDDFLARLQMLAEVVPDMLRARYFLKPLRPRAAMEAVILPAERAGVRVDEAAARQVVEELLAVRVDVGGGMVADVKGDVVEPVQLQVVCRHLWEALPAGTTVITVDHVQRCGDVGKALEAFYDEAVQTAAANGRVGEMRIREWVQETLITNIGTRGSVVQGPTSAGGMPNAVADLLLERHLLRSEWRAGARWFELSHDQLIGPVENSNRLYFQRPAATPPVRARDVTEIRREIDRLLAAGMVEHARNDAEKAYHDFLENDDRWSAANMLTCLGEIAKRSATGDDEATDEAITHYQSALDEFEELDDAYWVAMVHGEIGVLQFERGAYELALAEFNHALTRISTDSAEDAAFLYNGRGTAYWYTGDMSSAVEDFTRALGINPRMLEARNGRGQARTELGEYESGLEDLDQVIEECDDFQLAAYARSAQGFAFGSLGRHDEAERAFKHALRDAPDNAWTFWRRARVWHRVGRIAEAVADIHAALERKGPPLTSTQIAAARKMLAELTGATSPDGD